MLHTNTQTHTHTYTYVHIQIQINLNPIFTLHSQICISYINPHNKRGGGGREREKEREIERVCVRVCDLVNSDEGKRRLAILRHRHDNLRKDGWKEGKKDGKKVETMEGRKERMHNGRAKKRMDTKDGYEG